MAENINSSANGHRFTVDDGSIYWTQQVHDDSQPQFKNDHQQPSPETASKPSTERSEFMSPPPMSPTLSSIYRTDDQHDQRDEDDDKRFVSARRKDVTVPVGSVTAVGLDHDFRYDDSPFVDEMSNGSSDNDDVHIDHQPEEERMTTASIETMSTNYDLVKSVDGVEDDDSEDDENNGGSYWEAKQRRWTEENQQNSEDVDDGDSGYQTLICRTTNSLYTPFRW